MTPSTALRGTSLSLAVTVLSAMAVPGMAAAAEAAPVCSVEVTVLSCVPATPETTTAETTTPETTAPEETAPEVACSIEMGDGGPILICVPATPEVTTPVVAPPVSAPPVDTTPEPTVELPTSLTDSVATANSENPLGACVAPAPVAILVDDSGTCLPEAVFLGDAAGNMNEGALLSRGQASGAIARMLELSELGGMPTGRDHFADDNGSVHEAALNQLADFGIIRGTTSGVVDAGGTVTGRQLASMLHRTLVHTGHFSSQVSTHTAAASDLEAVGVTLGSGAVTRGEAIAAVAAVLSHMQA